MYESYIHTGDHILKMDVNYRIFTEYIYIFYNKKGIARIRCIVLIKTFF